MDRLRPWFEVARWAKFLWDLLPESVTGKIATFFGAAMSGAVTFLLAQYQAAPSWLVYIAGLVGAVGFMVVVLIVRLRKVAVPRRDKLLALDSSAGVAVHARNLRGGVSLSLENKTLDSIPACAIRMMNIEEYSVEHNEYKRDTFQTPIPHRPMTLLKPCTVTTSKPSGEVDLVRVSNRLKAQIQISDKSGQSPDWLWDQAGVFRVQLSIEVNGSDIGEQYVYFKWTPGETPILTEEPTQE